MIYWLVRTNYEDPETGKYEWMTKAKSAKKALNNIRARVHFAHGLPYWRICTTYWTAEAVA